MALVIRRWSSGACRRSRSSCIVKMNAGSRAVCVVSVYCQVPITVDLLRGARRQTSDARLWSREREISRIEKAHRRAQSTSGSTGASQREAKQLPHQNRWRSLSVYQLLFGTRFSFLCVRILFARLCVSVLPPFSCVCASFYRSCGCTLSAHCDLGSLSADPYRRRFAISVILMVGRWAATFIDSCLTVSCSNNGYRASRLLNDVGPLPIWPPESE